MSGACRYVHLVALTIDVRLGNCGINSAMDLRLHAEGLDVLDFRVIVHSIGRVLARGVVWQRTRSGLNHHFASATLHE